MVGGVFKQRIQEGEGTVGGVFKQRIQEGISLPTLIIFLVYIYIHVVSCHNYMYYFLEPLIFFSHIML